MKKVAVIASFLLAYIVFLIISTPARVVMQWVELPSNVILGNVSGTIWHAKVDALKINQEVVHKIEIKPNVWSFFTFDPSINVTFGDALLPGPEGQATIAGLLSDVRFSQTKITESANRIVSKLSLPVALTAHQFVDVSIDEFVAGEAGCQALAGDVRWANAAVTALDEKIALGDLQATLTCQQGAIVLTLQEPNNLGLSFDLYLGQNAQVSGDGYLKPTAQMPKAIEQMVPFLGSPDNQGRYRLRF
ncbi:type II secretion system protein N [Thalassotalea sp. G2M2-11]|uniref:type II secretion system protein N n=1 Tax=Thalassotalea sp. G2M2-11 TaxID=2787627 RepID=UPI0019D036AC|nr:type II secretion system protein N [Thalassotalea sp. G2M2-11]